MHSALPPFLWDATDFAKTENYDPCLALRDSIDKHGIFSKYDEDHLEFPDYCHFRAMCLRQALRTYEPSKEKID